MIYYAIALFCTVLFIAQFILSMIFGAGDMEVDFDGDGSTDFDLSGLFSFKGLIHFGIGFAWTMWFEQGQENKFLAATIAVGVGVLTAIILALVYWGALKLKNEITPETGEDLVGKTTEIYCKAGEGDWMVFLEINGGQRKLQVTSESLWEYKCGEKTEILRYQGGKYWIP